MQAQRPLSAHSATNQKVGPGWYHVRHTAIDKHPHSALVKSSASSGIRPASAAAHTGAVLSLQRCVHVLHGAGCLKHQQ